MSEVLSPASVKAWDEKVLSTAAAHAADFTGQEVSFSNNGNIMVLFHNVGVGGAIVVTFETPAVFDDDLDLDDRVLSIGQDEVVLVGPFSPRIYNDPDGNLTMTTVATEPDLEVMAFYK